MDGQHPAMGEQPQLQDEVAGENAKEQQVTNALEDIRAAMSQRFAERRAAFHSAPYGQVVNEVTQGDVDFLLNKAFTEGVDAAIDAALAFKNEELIGILQEKLVKGDWERQKQQMH